MKATLCGLALVVVVAAVAALATVGCGGGGGACVTVAEKTKACWESMDCTTKATTTEQTACETEKANEIAMDPAAAGLVCSGIIESLAEACVDKTFSTDNDCACSL